MTNCSVKDGGVYFNGNADGVIDYTSFLKIMDNNYEKYTIEICFKSLQKKSALLFCVGENYYPGMSSGGAAGIGFFGGSCAKGTNPLPQPSPHTFKSDANDWLIGVTQSYEFISITEQKGFVNGESAIDNNLGDGLWCHDDEVRIGRRKNPKGSDYGYQYNGIIYNIRLYHRLLDEGEVRHNYNIDKQLFNIDS